MKAVLKYWIEGDYWELYEEGTDIYNMWVENGYTPIDITSPKFQEAWNLYECASTFKARAHATLKEFYQPKRVK